MASPPTSTATAAGALDALQKSRAQAEANDVLAGKDLSSLNKFLQWSTAHSAPPDAPSPARAALHAKTPEQLAADRAWLDVAFPDMNAGVRDLVCALTSTPAPSSDAAEEALLALEEYFVDLNYAVNIDKLGALEPILQYCANEDAAVRAAATWALASALQGLGEVRAAVLGKGGERVVAAAVSDADARVRGKGVLAASALLRHAGEEVWERFEKVGGVGGLKEALVDEDGGVRKRALFFLEHAEATGGGRLVEAVLGERRVLGGVVGGVGKVDVEDVGEVEALVGGVGVLVEKDRQGVLLVAPELPGVVDELVKRCQDAELADKLRGLADILG